jgi:hypothetical protein
MEMGWILLAVAVAVYVGVLRYGWDSRDGLDWQTGVPMGARRVSTRPPRHATPAADVRWLLAHVTARRDRRARAVRAG